MERADLTVETDVGASLAQKPVRSPHSRAAVPVGFPRDLGLSTVSALLKEPPPALSGEAGRSPSVATGPGRGVRLPRYELRRCPGTGAGARETLWDPVRDITEPSLGLLDDKSPCVSFMPFDGCKSSASTAGIGCGRVYEIFSQVFLRVRLSSWHRLNESAGSVSVALGGEREGRAWPSGCVTRKLSDRADRDSQIEKQV